MDNSVGPDTLAQLGLIRAHSWEFFFSSQAKLIVLKCSRILSYTSISADLTVVAIVPSSAEEQERWVGFGEYLFLEQLARSFQGLRGRTCLLSKNHSSAFV